MTTAESGCLSSLRFAGETLLISGPLKHTTTMLDDLTTAHGLQPHSTNTQLISHQRCMGNLQKPPTGVDGNKDTQRTCQSSSMQQVTPSFLDASKSWTTTEEIAQRTVNDVEDCHADELKSHKKVVPPRNDQQQSSHDVDSNQSFVSVSQDDEATENEPGGGGIRCDLIGLSGCSPSVLVLRVSAGERAGEVARSGAKTKGFLTKT